MNIKSILLNDAPFRKFPYLGLACAFTLLLASSFAEASSLYAVGFQGSGLYNIDSNTGVVNSILGGVGNELDNGLAYNRNTGQMFGLISTNEPFELYTVDYLNSGIRNFVSNTSQWVTALAYDANTDVTFTIDQFGALATVDLTSGIVTSVSGSPIAFSPTGGPVALAVDSKGNLFSSAIETGQIYSVDRATGIGIELFTLFDGSNGFTALAFDENDQLFGVTTFSDLLTSIDITFGTATTIASLANLDVDIRGMSFAPDYSPVPIPSAMLLFGTGLIGLFGIARKKVA